MLEKYCEKPKLRLGFAPTRRTKHTPKMFSIEEAISVKKRVEAVVSQYDVEIVNLDFLNEEGLLYSGLDADAVAARFIEKNVDAVFVPHCNFGCEDAVSKLAARVRKPLLLWGIREDFPDSCGYRYRDAQCGLFPTGKVLRRFGVPFTYITNSLPEDETFCKGFQNFLAAASAVRDFTNLRIGQVSNRPDAFWSVKCNEGELLERFGIEIIPVTFPDLTKMVREVQAERKEKLELYIQRLKQRFSKIDFGDEQLMTVASLRFALEQWMEREQLSAVASHCWGPMVETIGISPCFVFSELVDCGLPVICENDVHGAITAVLAQGASQGSSPIFLADATARHPEKDNVELFWHCGVFPKSVADPNSTPFIGRHHNRHTAAAGQFRIRPGEVTISRFDGDNGMYSLLFGRGNVVDGPFVTGTYGWIEFSDWPLWEHKLVKGPYIHHCVGSYGDITAALYEACKYIPGLQADPVVPTEEEIEKILRGQ